VRRRRRRGRGGSLESSAHPLADRMIDGQQVRERDAPGRQRTGLARDRIRLRPDVIIV